MTHAIRIHELGGPEVLRWESVEVPDPGPGEVLLSHTAIGLNYIDVYHRTGLYKVVEPPFVPGMEAAGVVDAVGPHVEELAVGDRVAYASTPLGAYSEQRVMPAERLLRLPDAVDDRTAAAMMLKGMTACYLLRRSYRVQAGDHVLIHAAAGGVGTIACQWASHLGATVIGTVGSPQKAESAAAHGCTHPIDYTREDFVERVRDITGGKGVAAVYDSVGADTFMRSLDCLRPFGTLVSFGQSSGNPPPLDVGILAKKGSLYVQRPTIATYTAKRQDMVALAGELFDTVTKGAVRIEIGTTFALRDAGDAHRALEARRTTGSTLLIP